MLVERRGTTGRKPAVVAGAHPLSESPGGESNGLRDIGHIQEELAVLLRRSVGVPEESKLMSRACVAVFAAQGCL